MEKILYISAADHKSLEKCKELLKDAEFICNEKRENHTAHYPLHNRYFTNGDKPFVILINKKNEMKLKYHDKTYTLKEGELVLFDDNVMHSWEMKNNDMEIFYYRAKAQTPIMEGTYCLG